MRRLLGIGGCALVYEAEHAVTGGRVALKALGEQDHASAVRLEREARVLNVLEGTYAPRVLDAGRLAGGSLYLAMELLDGTSLEDRLAEGPMSLDEIAMLARELLRAVATIHDRGIVHRDIKPSNILLVRDASGELAVKVIDFGICRVSDGSPVVTAPGLLVGTALYMAPEQIHTPEVDARADVYSVGVVLYECITGRPPFIGERIVDVIEAVLHAPLILPSELRRECPMPLEGVVLRAMARSLVDRYESAWEMLEAVELARRVQHATTQPVPLVVGRKRDESGVRRRTPLRDDHAPFPLERERRSVLPLAIPDRLPWWLALATALLALSQLSGL